MACTDVCGPWKMNPNDFGDPFTFHPTGQSLYLNIQLRDWHEILHIYSQFLDVES